MSANRQASTEANILPEIVRDFQLAIHCISKRGVTHVCDDPDAPPSSQRHLERWSSEKRPIGGGGQGRVFLQKCSNSNSGSHRAVKEIPLQEGNKKRQYYLRELETMARFSHSRYSKYFVNLLGWYELENSLCIAMEYLPHGDLQAYLCQNTVSEDDGCRIISQVLQGLEFMHRGGFSHGDVKPKNILIKQHQTPEGGSAWWVKLADFGISKRVREASGATTVMGTEEYIAPELRRRNPADGNSIDFPATDIWSVGAMAFFILTGTPAFYSAWETFNYIQTPDTLFPRARLEHYHVTLVGQAIIRALMEPRPDQRLTARAAILHDWIWPCIPSDPVAMISSARSRTASLSSTASSSQSLFDGERGLTTQMSDITGLPTSFQPGMNVQPTPASLTLPIRSAQNTSTKTTTTSSAEPKTAIITPAPKMPAENLDPVSRSQERPASSPVSEVPADENLYRANHRSSERPRREASIARLPSAIDIGSEAQVNRLLKNGDIETLNDYGQTPLSGAAQRGHKELVRLLVENGANVESTDTSDKKTPLSSAADKGHIEVVRLLAEKGADVESRDTHDLTALIYAARGGHKEVVRLLVEKGADVESRDTHCKRTPLSWAAHAGQNEVVRLLIEIGADFESTNGRGEAPLELAALQGHTEVVRLLVEKGANVESRDTRYSRTPLAWAAQKGCTEVVGLLVEKGADVESRDRRGYTPLTWATKEGHEATVKLLLEKGADRKSIPWRLRKPYKFFTSESDYY